jgi:uncharacterized DUF497 family protein
MSEGADYEFEWDDTKAESNLAKHGVDFWEAMRRYCAIRC